MVAGRIVERHLDADSPTPDGTAREAARDRLISYAGKPTVRDTRVAVDADKIRLLSELFDALCHSEQTDRQQKWADVAESRLNSA